MSRFKIAHAARRDRLTSDQVAVRTRRLDVSSRELEQLGQGAARASSVEHRPILHALADGSADVRNDGVHMPSLEGHDLPSVLQSLKRMHPRDVRMERTGSRYRLMAHLNPWVALIDGQIVHQWGRTRLKREGPPEDGPSRAEIRWMTNTEYMATQRADDGTPAASSTRPSKRARREPDGDGAVAVHRVPALFRRRAASRPSSQSYARDSGGPTFVHQIVKLDSEKDLACWNLVLRGLHSTGPVNPDDYFNAVLGDPVPGGLSAEHRDELSAQQARAKKGKFSLRHIAQRRRSLAPSAKQHQLIVDATESIVRAAGFRIVSDADAEAFIVCHYSGGEVVRPEHWWIEYVQDGERQLIQTVPDLDHVELTSADGEWHAAGGRAPDPSYRVLRIPVSGLHPRQIELFEREFRSPPGGQ